MAPERPDQHDDTRRNDATQIPAPGDTSAAPSEPTPTYAGPPGASLSGGDGWSSQGTSSAPTVPGYKLHHQLGAGGMGVVWLATQEGTQRKVALKLMSAATVGSPKLLARFEREVELAASLDHIHVGRVYDGGVSGDLRFFAMEYIRGEELSRYLQRVHPNLREIVRLMIAVCNGVQHAHQRGIIHRDLKPANVLIAEDGTPKILDFGLARAVTDSATLLSVEGEIAGTPAYMSPEQARGDLKQTDTRSDVYSLGAILYEAIAGRLPHPDKGSQLELLQRVADEDATPCRRVNPAIEMDLEAIVMKALARDVAERYRTAGELGDELGRYLRGDIVLARPQTTIYLLRKHVRRHAGVAGATATLVILALGALGFYVVSLNREQGRTHFALQTAYDERARQAQALDQANEERAASSRLITRLLYETARGLDSAEARSETSRTSLLTVLRDGVAEFRQRKGFEEQMSRLATSIEFQMAETKVEAGDAVAGVAQAQRAYNDMIAQAHVDPRDRLAAGTRLARMLVAAHRDADAQALITELRPLNADDDALARLASDRLSLIEATLQVQAGSPVAGLATLKPLWEQTPKPNSEEAKLRLSAGVLRARCLLLRDAMPSKELEATLRELGSASGLAPIERIRAWSELDEVFTKRGQPTSAAEALREAVALARSELAKRADRESRPQMISLLNRLADATATTDPAESVRTRETANAMRSALEAEDRLIQP